MRREPSLTFEGALRILGRHELPGVEKLDNILGGVILTAGAAAGLATVGPAALAPMKAFAAVWGWLEQKDAALKLLRGAIGKLSDKLAGTKGLERRELIAAAHSVIVVAAFFESFREHVGESFYKRLAITDEEQRFLIARSTIGETLYETLYAAEIPAPSAALGYSENVQAVAAWYSMFISYFEPFLQGLSVAEYANFEWSAVKNGAVERYQSHFLKLSARVPEFMIWFLLAEGAATRTEVAGLRQDIAQALDANRNALGRVCALLGLDDGHDATLVNLRGSVARANGGFLAERIVPEDAQGYEGIEFPTVGDSYVNPRYRLARVGQRSISQGTAGIYGMSERPADETWWDKRASRDDFDLMLSGYVTSPEATALPMLLLGHPGAGKSMLTKILAARLPTSAYTVIRVPLRRVGANAPVVKQIEQALSEATNGRVDSWWRLAEQSRDTVRVVLLDGLDELLQASSANRSGYLQEVEEFQRHEAEQGQPVVVIVTSRTVVADRVEIPAGTVAVKLDFFEDEDIAAWLDRWCEVNAAGIAAGVVRGLSLRAIAGDAGSVPSSDKNRKEDDNTDIAGKRVLELARQPLLLLMLALYAADPSLPPLDGSLATADLYRQLLESFSRREAVKVLGPSPRQSDLDQQVRDHMDRLAIAALAMFNRGRQDIGEEELGADLAALDPRLMERSRPSEAGARIIGEFFFVHAPEARMLTGGVAPAGGRRGTSSDGEALSRSYEFLHATFGEYLVAHWVISELVEVAARTFAGRRGPAEPDDDLLYALLSHRPLTSRESTLDFAEEMYRGLPGKEREQAFKVLAVLIGGYRDRHGSDRYAAYRPTPSDRVRELAAYSANLVALRWMLDSEDSIPLTTLFGTTEAPLDLWRSTVMLWKAGLDTDSLDSMTWSFKLAEQAIVGVGGGHFFLSPNLVEIETVRREISIARMTGDETLERSLRYGVAIVAGHVYSYDDETEDWLDEMASMLIPGGLGQRGLPFFRAPEATISEDDIRIVAKLVFAYLRYRRGTQQCVDVLRFLFSLPRIFRIDHLTLAALVLNQPDLLNEIPQLSDVELYGKYAVFLGGFLPDVAVGSLSEDSIKTGQEFLEKWIIQNEEWEFPEGRLRHLPAT